MRSSSEDEGNPASGQNGSVEKMYETELNRGYFQDKTDNGGNSKPYNEWRNENGHLFTPKNTYREEPFVSSLGQNLQSMDKIVPANPAFAEQNDKFSPRYDQERVEPHYRQERQIMKLQEPYKTVPANPVFAEQNDTFSPRYEHERVDYRQQNIRFQEPYQDAMQYQHKVRVSPQYIQAQRNFQQEPRNSPRYQHQQSMQHFSHQKPPRYHPEPQITPPRPNFYMKNYDYDYYSPNSPYYNREIYPPRHIPCSCEAKKKERNKEEKIRKKQISDLYRIVYLQNQQLSSLQNQVQKLIEMAVKNDEGPDVSKKKRGSKETRTFNLEVIEENRNMTEKVSVGIMTSFMESKKKVEESSESESSDSSEEPIKNQKKSEESYMLNGVQIPTIVENVPSPQNSFHLELQDYSSSSSTDESDTSSEEGKANQVGWTFYDNVVGKVNNLLKNEDESGDEIKNATLDQLKKLGISFVESEITPKRVTFDQRACKEVEIPHKLHSECDTSTRMNALASKYLEGHAGKFSKPKEFAGGSSNTNLSFATMRYLERYCLVPKEKSPKNDERKKKKVDKKKKNSSKSGKILDITAIKKQPKLLPKK